MGFLAAIHCHWLYDGNVAFKIIDAYVKKWLNLYFCVLSSAYFERLRRVRIAVHLQRNRKLCQHLGWTKDHLDLILGALPPQQLAVWGGKEQCNCSEVIFKILCHKSELFDSAETILKRSHQVLYLDHAMMIVLNVWKMYTDEHVLYVFILK